MQLFLENLYYLTTTETLLRMSIEAQTTLSKILFHLH